MKTVVALLFVLSTRFVRASQYCKGCVELDTPSFEKVVSRFPASVVKFDIPYPYGEKHKQFEKLSETLALNSDILVAEVGVQDHGSMENVALAKKYKIVKEDYPVILLFKKGQKEPIRYQGEFKLEPMQRFVRSKSGVYIGLPGCLETFDKLAQQFVSSETPDKRKAVLREAEDSWNKTSLSSDRKSAEIYVRIMRKMLDNVDNFVQNEVTRVSALRDGNLTKDIKDQMDMRLNILQSFVVSGKTEKTEL